MILLTGSDDTPNPRWEKKSGIRPERRFNHNKLHNIRFSLYTLKKRRAVHRLKFVYDLLQNTIDCTWLLERKCFLVSRFNSRQSAFFYSAFHRTNVIGRSIIISGRLNSYMTFSFGRFLQVLLTFLDVLIECYELFQEKAFQQTRQSEVRHVNGVDKELQR